MGSYCRLLQSGRWTTAARGVVRVAAGLLLALTAFGVPRVVAKDAVVIEDGGVTLEFPDKLTFSAHIESDADIERVVLEYGVEKLTCGTVIAKAFPDFEPGQSIDVSWTWEMLQSGSEPPGARIWYRWRAIDKEGNEGVSDEQRVVWIDDDHDWQSVSRDVLTIHWYSGSRAFAEDLLNSAVESLAALGETTGIVPEWPIDLYIYADTDDMRDAVLYEPGWTGGLAFPDQDIVIIGISPNQIEWGKDTEAHELTHVLVGHLTFSCLGSVPTWLNEGIAVYGEGGLDPASAEGLQRAIEDDELISLRALSGGFSEHAGKADLSYSQSYSVVDYLVAEHGPDRLLSLFKALRDGMTIEDALNDVYSFGLDGLEDAWRASVDASPRQAEDATPEPTPQPTPVPTYPLLAMLPTYTPSPTLPPSPTPRPTATAVAAVSSPTLAAPSAASVDNASPVVPIVVVAGVAIVGVLGVTQIIRRRNRS